MPLEPPKYSFPLLIGMSIPPHHYGIAKIAAQKVCHSYSSDRIILRFCGNHLAVLIPMITVHFPVLSPCIYTALCNYSIVLEFALYVFFGLILAVLFFYWPYAFLHTIRVIYKKSVYVIKDIYWYQIFCKLDRAIPSRKGNWKRKLFESKPCVYSALYMFSIEIHLYGNHITGILSHLRTNHRKWTKRLWRFHTASIFRFNLLQVFFRHKNLPFWEVSTFF